MDIIISNSSGDPIYLQIVNQIKALIISGELAVGEALPSMRTLAASLRISIITTKRAYEELERDGFIESYTGRGSFVKAQNSELLKEHNLCKIEELLNEVAGLAGMCGVSSDELCYMIKLIMEDNSSKN